MSTEELAERIQELGASIAAAKKEKKPLEEWKPLLDEMLALKVCVLALLQKVILKNNTYISTHFNFYDEKSDSI
jgi:hypothetical protein